MPLKISKIIIAVLATITGLYPGIYFLIDRKFGLLGSKSDELLANNIWNVGFYTHIVLGGVALLVGWIQFNTKLRLTNLSLHRAIGKIYVACVLPSALAGIGIGFFATGGLITATGFISLGIIWLTTTLLAFLKIKNGQIEQHRRLMIYSYAACLAAVTLRIWLPILIIIFGNFLIAYRIVAWLCWVPNILIATTIIRKLDHIAAGSATGRHSGFADFD